MRVSIKLKLGIIMQLTCLGKKRRKAIIQQSPLMLKEDHIPLLLIMNL